MAIRRTLAQFSDEIVAADLADNSVTTAKIADSQITAAKVAADVATQAELNVVSTAVDNVDTSTAMKPHIRTDVLYPAVANVMLDGTTALSAVTTGPNSSTVASSKYGTVQSDGRMYYYTDIKGSKPIKDPRIGAHFGSQRHKFKSLQILEQETATHGKNVYSVDGREWIRISEQTASTVVVANNAHGDKIDFNGNVAGTIIEITGYFNDANVATVTDTNRPSLKVSLNGTQGVASSSALGGVTTAGSPIDGRYVPCGSLMNIGDVLSPSFGSTPQIYTLTLEMIGGGHYGNIENIELIAQDTSNVNNIQIPSQNVVSYGKKFTVSGTPHYDPFNGFVNDTTLFSARVDMATSLGLGTATTWGAAWDKGSSNHIRPYNGGRVVKWVDSAGVIKTSVNMMPANAQNISTTAAAEITTPSATNVYLPAFSDDAINHSLAEVAKTFHWREFGNGAANAGTNGATADASMLSNTNDDISYAMDDGLTSLTGNSLRTDNETLSMLHVGNTGDYAYLTFIGTGISLVEQDDATSGTANNYDWYIDGVKVKDTDTGSTNKEYLTVAQNLPYGSHILKIDCVAAATFGQRFIEFTIHQPQMPPIPEDTCIIADYMLMADFVPIPVASYGSNKVSKGVRTINSSRDFFSDASTGSMILDKQQDSTSGGFKLNSNTTGSAGVYFAKLPVFGTNFVWRGYDVGNRGQLKVNGSNATQTTTTGTASWNTVGYISSGEPVLGVNIFEATNKASQELQVEYFEVASPIHTSSHYQTFETPFLHELVGGDRNMEQTNLVVTPDGKTWDEVTRDVSYIGDTVLAVASTTGDNANATVVILDECRGRTNVSFMGWKDSWVMAYDRVICLKAGEYRVEVPMLTASGQGADVRMNGTAVLSVNGISGQRSQSTIAFSHSFKRGDYLQCFGGYWPNVNYNHLRIYKEK